MVAIAKRNHPRIRFETGDDASLPADLVELDAILAIGEVLGYVGEGDREPLQVRLRRLVEQLRPGGLLVLDLAAPSRVNAVDQRTWTTGNGWAVLSEADAEYGSLRRTIITFRQQPSGDYRRRDEIHELELHAPEEVIAALEAAGARDPRHDTKYAGLQLPVGLIAYSARRREFP